MKAIIYFFIFLSVSGFIFNGCNGGSEQTKDATADSTDTMTESVIDTNAVPGVMPYTILFFEQKYSKIVPPLPALQSYVATMSKQGLILVIGGRSQGLHTFSSAPDTNFLPKKANNFLHLIDPVSGKDQMFDVNKLPPSLSAPLQATNQEMYHDLETDMVYVMGGYGWKADGSDMVTFNTITAFKMEAVVAAIQSNASPEAMAALFQQAQDDRFAVTGGELFKMNGQFYLVFGQTFMGQYRAFGGTDFSQVYTEQVRVFTLAPGTLKILSYGATISSDPDHPFHRRDGNIISDVDPKTGNQRIASYGGVFRPGIIGAYTYPVFISSPATPIVDKTGNQKFSQYECPVITIYDSSTSNPTVYHTFFGGIGHYYYWQTPKHKAAFDTVTVEHRNDGFPFVADISHFQQSADGSYKEFIYPSPIPGNRLLGSSVKFIESRNLMSSGMAYPNGVIKLPKISATAKQLIGYIYGGIEAQNPLPLIPNTGTFVSNSVFAVYLVRTPAAAIPASFAHESTIDTANLHRQ